MSAALWRSVPVLRSTVPEFRARRGVPATKPRLRKLLSSCGHSAPEGWIGQQDPLQSKARVVEPTASAMNCCPPDAKVIGEVLMVAFSGTRHNIFPHDFSGLDIERAEISRR